MKTTVPLLKLKRGLKDSARSFYLSLILFPPILRNQVSVAYFLCKTADTIVDGDHFTKGDREEILFQFYKAITGKLTINDLIKLIESKQLSNDIVPLFSLIPDASIVLHQFSDSDQHLILGILNQVISGMNRDLKGEPLKNEEELDQYCYDVAGSAGEFLTKIFYRYHFINKNLDEMIDLGVQLGRGLQLTNILRDQAEDLERGRFYLPPGADFASDSVILPKTVSYLENGLRYVISVPKRGWRIRLASLLPLLFAIKTIAKIIKTTPLKFSNKIKLSRFEIYKTMFVSFLVVFSNLGITLYFESIKKETQSVQGVKR